ncbi:MAG TPA: hypothetical protein VLW65_11755 [Bryobacteraceae bacterium]|nr:hypothetical protein [Bryobacteraceae bacterium]
MDDPVSRALEEIKSALNELQVQFCIVGSLASSAHGVPRATMDVDLLTRISRDQANRLASTLGASWSVDVQAANDALRHGRAFNIFNLPAGLKFDFFPAFNDFHNAQLERATTMALADGTVRCPIASAEDVVLAKLQWYRLGGEVSETQWRDILGLLQAGPLDSTYMRTWARRLRVDDLLSRAFAESHVHPRS